MQTLSVEELKDRHKICFQAVLKSEEKLKELDVRKKLIEQVAISFRERLKQAAEEKRIALSKYALGEITQDELGKVKKIFFDLSQEGDESVEMFDVIKKAMVDVQRQLDAPFTGLRADLQIAEAALWRAIFLTLSEDLIKSSRSKIIRSFVAYSSSGKNPIMARCGGFLEELFKITSEPDLDEQRQIKKELCKEFGIA